MQAWFGVQSQQWQWSCFWCSTSLLAYEVVPSAFTSLSLEAAPLGCFLHVYPFGY